MKPLTLMKPAMTKPQLLLSQLWWCLPDSIKHHQRKAEDAVVARHHNQVGTAAPAATARLPLHAK
jgi:hypothetical protein